jgi:outer membrane protein TolC
VTASEAAVLAKEAEVRMQVRSLYWGLKLGAEVLQVVEDARKESLRAEEMVTTKLEEGSEEVTQTDLFKVQVFRYQVEKRYREAQRKSALAQRALASAIGLDENTPLMPTDEPLDLMTFILDSLANYQAIAMASRPELRQLDAGIRARSALSGVSSADYYPTIFLGGQIRLNRAMDRADPRNPFLFNQTNFTRMGAVLGLTMNLNLQQTRDKARIARREEELLSAQVIPARAGVRLEVEKAWREAEEAVSNVAGSTEALKATDNWLRSEAQVFDLGLGEVKDFIDAFQAHSTMRAEHAENIAAFNTAIAALGRAIGRDLYRQ